LLDFFLTIQGF